jgi:hypothetical protein
MTVNTVAVADLATEAGWQMRVKGACDRAQRLRRDG